jgi:hypothetical protein
LPQTWTTFVIFKKKLAEANDHPMGENSSNLVTLFSSDFFPQKMQQRMYPGRPDFL